MRVKFLHPVWEEFPLEPATQGSAGIDLRAAMDVPAVDIPPGGRHAFGTGLAIEIAEPGLAGFVYSRSGLGAKHGLTVAQGVGVIDPDYRGEIVVWLLNTSETHKTVARGERIAQLLVMPYRQAAIQAADELGDTSRGAGGFGHTGSV
nr:dUTP diphosphatase [Fundidesulfovibrio magnetotacticus]